MTWALKSLYLTTAGMIAVFSSKHETCLALLWTPTWYIRVKKTRSSIQIRYCRQNFSWRPTLLWFTNGVRLGRVVLYTKYFCTSQSTSTSFQVFFFSSCSSFHLGVLRCSLQQQQQLQKECSKIIYHHFVYIYRERPLRVHWCMYVWYDMQRAV